MAESNETASGLARRLDTPSRESLLQQYARSEEFSKKVLWTEGALAAAGVVWLVAQAPRLSGVWPWIAAAIGGFGVFRWLIQHAFLNKKRLEEIRPDAQFGVHNRATLLALTERVFERLGLPSGAAPVFLTRDKDINAQAVRCELWPGRRVFNGVFLNRSIIHLLDESELASVIGHELGHVFPYAPILSRSYALHAAACAVISAALTAAFASPGVALAAPIVLIGIVETLILVPRWRLSRGIEFLCDDFGARAAGLLPALSAEVKLTLEHETRLSLFHRTLASKKAGANLTLRDLMEAYETAMPFGKADPAAFEQEIRGLAADGGRQARGLSLSGFGRFLQGGEGAGAEDWIDEQLALAEILRELPLIPMERKDYLRGSAAWSMGMAGALARVIENSPGAVLARLPQEVEDRGASHPSPSRRYLFLWRERGGASE